MGEPYFAFEAPPLPHFLEGGTAVYRAGERHLERTGLGVFDLIFVRSGALYLGENGRAWRVGAGESLLLRPDGHHYPTEPCREKTEIYWFHFQTAASWTYVSDGDSVSKPVMNETGTEMGGTKMAGAMMIGTEVAGTGGIERGGTGTAGVGTGAAEKKTAGTDAIGNEAAGTGAARTGAAGTETAGTGTFGQVYVHGVSAPFRLVLPQYAAWPDGIALLEACQAIAEAGRDAPARGFWRQQRLFHALLEKLDESRRAVRLSPAVRLAELTEAYIRQHYREPFTNGKLAEVLHFHPNYIARCMKAVHGCTPLEYLMRYRLDQARLLLMNTSWPVERIAEHVGLGSPAHFSRSFRRQYGLSPQQFRRGLRKRER